MASSIAVIKFLMSPRSNGVMNVRRTAVVTPSNRCDERPPSRVERLAGDVVGIVFKLIDALAENRRFLTTLKHALQRERALLHRLGMPGKEIEKPLFLGKESAKPTQHGYVQNRTKVRPEGLS